MHNQSRQNTVPVFLQVAPNFSGAVCVYLKNGKETAQSIVRPDEFYGTLATFLELAQAAGYRVTPPAA